MGCRNLIRSSIGYKLSEVQWGYLSKLLVYERTSSGQHVALDNVRPSSNFLLYVLQ